MAIKADHLAREEGAESSTQREHGVSALVVRHGAGLRTHAWRSQLRCTRTSRNVRNTGARAAGRQETEPSPGGGPTTGEQVVPLLAGAQVVPSSWRATSVERASREDVS